MKRYDALLGSLVQKGNFRSIQAEDSPLNLIDLSSNDYLGIGTDTDLQAEFLRKAVDRHWPLTSSASRLLAGYQSENTALEQLLSRLYGGRSVLLFNSGYHANTGLVSALAAGSDTLIVADKLVHASIIDGITLAKVPFERFAHNNIEHLRRILDKKAGNYDRVLIITESVFSMDGDYAPLDELIEVKADYPGVMLYVDEAHAFGVCGPGGLGCVMQSLRHKEVDVIVGTFGKAAASIGAFCAVNSVLRDVAVNYARSLIFSTALPPLNVAWTRFVVERLADMEDRREKLRMLSNALTDAVGGPGEPSHIRPLIVGNPIKATELSQKLLADGFKVLPIRTPTVPPGTERLRFSLSTDLSVTDMLTLKKLLKAYAD